MDIAQNWQESQPSGTFPLLKARPWWNKDMAEQDDFLAWSTALEIPSLSFMGAVLPVGDELAVT